MLQKVLTIEQELNQMFLERYDVIRGSLVALLYRKNILLLGAPGTAKSMVSRELCNRIEGTVFFKYLFTKFTTPEEIFGPFSLKALENDEYYRITQGRLPEAHIAFADEIYKGSSAIANTLLTIINERKFINGSKEIDVPLQCLFAASNEMPPESEELAAFHDRFHLKYEVRYIQERSSFINMLKNQQTNPDRTRLTLEELASIQKQVEKVQISDEVYDLIDKIRFALSKEGILVSDRVFNASQDLIRTSAWMSESQMAQPEDLGICAHAYWDEPKKQRTVKQIVLQAASKELLELEQHYEIAQELIRPKTSLDDNSEVKESLEVRKKLKQVIKVFDEHIPVLEKKKLPVFKFKTMKEAVRDRLFQIETDMLGDEMTTAVKRKKEAKEKA
jgi:MoxR-like ATPase